MNCNVLYNVEVHSDEICKFSSNHKSRSRLIENQKSINFNPKSHENRPRMSKVG